MAPVLARARSMVTLNSCSVLAQLLLQEHGATFNQLASQLKRMGDLLAEVSAFIDVTSTEENFAPVKLADAVRDATGLLTKDIEATGAKVLCRSLSVVTGSRAKLKLLFRTP